MIKIKSLLRLSALLLILTSCLNLQTVHQFSEEALKSTAEFDRLQLTFQQLCEKKQILEAVQHGSIQRDYQDGCQLQMAADSAVLKMQQALVDYLSGLSLVTSNKRISYALDPVSQALQTNTLIHLQEEEVSAYQQMLELVAQAATEAYRKKKTSAYIAKAQEPLNTLIDQLIFVMDTSLREAAEQQKEMLYLQTRELADSAHSFLEKRSLILDYADRMDDYNQQLKLLDTYVALLQNIKEGYQQLYEKRDRLDKEDALETLIHYTGAIRQLQSEFEKIR